MIHRNRKWKREKIADRRSRQRVGETLLTRRFRQRVPEVLLALLLLFVVGEFVCANLFHYTRYMDADIAGEVLFAKMTAKNGLIPPSTWAYSTERRTLYPCRLGAVLYALTGNLNLSMGIACSLSFCFLLLLMGLLYKKAGFSRIELLCALLFTLTLTCNIQGFQTMIALYAGYYLSQMGGLFLTLLLLTGLSGKRREVGEKRRSFGNEVRMAGLILLAVLLGRQGMRAFLMVYLPIAGITFFLWLVKKRERGALQFVTALLLTFLNDLTVKITASNPLSTTRNLRHGPEKLFRVVIPQIGEMMQLPEGRWLWILPCVLGMIGLFFAGADCCRKQEEGDLLAAQVVLCLWASLMGMVFSASFTTMESSSRYFIALPFAIGVSCAYLLLRSRKKGESRCVRTLSLVMVLLALATGSRAAWINMDQLLLRDDTGNSWLAKAGKVLEEKGYDHAYSTFYLAGPVSVLTNGRVQVAQLDQFRDMKAMKWLSDASWYPPLTKSEEKTAFLVTEANRKDMELFLQKHPDLLLGVTELDGLWIYECKRNVTRWGE